MNNKGWGLSTLIICIVIIIIALLTATFFTIRLNNMLGKENNKTEKILNDKVEVNYYINKKINIKAAADKYINDFGIELTTTPIKIELKELISHKYINDVLDYETNNKCDGYAIAYLNNVDIKMIDSYIKCDKYKSEGYGGH